ncbi:MAG: NUDIX domain-containing protein [Acidobacteria bacterium]|nr:NUDIX domain-containing protein [Acidobacteriota bacterium]
MKAKHSECRIPERLFLAVPIEGLFDVLDDGLAPIRLHCSEKAARKATDIRRPAILTVLAWEAAAQGHEFEADGDGWRVTAALPHHLLACDDRRALAKLRVKGRQSCGGILISNLEDPRVLLLFKEKPGFTAWKLPKGGLEDGESRRQAARREVAEEAGIRRVRVLGKVGMIQYFKQGKKGRRREKTVDLFLMLSRDGECNIAPRKGESFVACAWLTFEEAIARVTQPEARGSIARARALTQRLNKR